MGMDELAVMETCTRMAWYTDQRDWSHVAEVLDAEVLLDYVSLNGGEPTTMTADQVVAAWADALSGFDSTQHLITNYLVTVNSDAAICTASFQATHRLENPHGSALWTLGGQYRFSLVRRDGGWRIAAIVMTTLWADGNQQLATLAAKRAAGPVQTDPNGPD